MGASYLILFSGNFKADCRLPDGKILGNTGRSLTEGKQPVSKVALVRIVIVSPSLGEVVEQK